METTFKPGDKVRHDGEERFVFYGGPVEGVVTEIEEPGFVSIEAVPVGEDPAHGTMRQSVATKHLTMIQEALF